MSFGGGPGTCLTGARFSMRATVLGQNDESAGPIDPDDYGEWVDYQDPLTGEIVNIWKPFEDNPDDPDTPDDNEQTFLEVPCVARGIVDGGIRVAGTTEFFGADYENMDYVKLWLPAHVRLTKRDRVTNIKDATGHIRWRDEEYEQRDPSKPLDLDDPTTYNSVLRATVFNVNGVTPLFDAMNRLVEWYVMLARAEV